MSPSAGDPEYADAYLNEWLTAMGLGVEYVRAAGDTVFYLDENGREVPVLDLACGFGSLIFGHNNPEIVAAAKQILDAQIPVHAQLSHQPHANRVAAALNTAIRRELRTDDSYIAIFGNSGAEAIEICMKHAELERRARIAVLSAEIGENIAQARAALRAGSAKIAPGPHISAELPVAAALAAVQKWNAERLAKRPIYLTLEHAFHGKLIGSIQLTQNEQWRTPFVGLASAARFVPVDRPDALAQIVADEREFLLDLVLDGATVQVVERDFPIVAAFFVEPIRGGAGLIPVAPELAREIEKTCVALGCPLVTDEVQSGLGRAGALLASSRLGLTGDYITLAKSIGGGIAKNSVALIRRDRFRPEFEVIHSSTFAKDGFSGHIALKVLDMLEADGGAAYRKADELGARLIAELEAVRAEFPELITQVCGLGLMLAIEIADLSASRNERIREQAASGSFGFVLAGYLLREHRIRVLPAGPGWRFIRFEPSIHLADAEVGRIGAALRDLGAVLRDQDDRRLLPQ
ncbi:aminotransferase class III-fold pyridoxal phosphate-dependent enzyme [Nocardia panacis]|uniref:Aminotransferase class III-fold pyridoxal phosphate-dependent enzyme n=1 Tax=Nocardia panacis TaxID=2340916 RepID=A0A3A4KCN5_9NOCA|nr:aminotransferase class III-fold pyridoxal phosphate-dependent enzyme [Nocardia panacis]RJO70072.1 aminotransferase class III-fold pyridoxal phosphate-dependent enzyme [Nocardia panacis]